MNIRQCKIYGKERRQKKQKLSLLKQRLKTFWQYHNLDAFMTEIYPCGIVIPNDLALKEYAKLEFKIDQLEIELSEPYIK